MFEYAPTPVQRSFDDLGTPLADVTFVVVDLETTGGSPGDDAITEIGAVKLRGGECLGTFATLVNPGREIPPTITFLTGITHSMVVTAPSIASVASSLESHVCPPSNTTTRCGLLRVWSRSVISW